MASRGRLLARTFIRSIAQQRSGPVNKTTTVGQLRTFSRAVETETLEPLHPDAERKIGWVLKGLAVATFTYVGMNVFPLMGDSFVTHSVALVKARDSFFKRSGASRISLIATDEKRRLKIVAAGGVGALVDMIQSASDDETRKEAAKALAVLSPCDAAVEAMHERGIQPYLTTLQVSSNDLETQQHTAILMERLEEWKTRGESLST